MGHPMVHHLHVAYHRLARAVRHFSIPSPDSPPVRVPAEARAKFVGIEHPTDTQIDVVITA